MVGGQPEDSMPHLRHRRGVLRRNAPYFGIAAVLLVLGLVATAVGLTNPDSGDALPLGVLTAVAAPLIALPVYLELRSRPRAAEATATGLAWRGRRGARSRPWDEASEVNLEYLPITDDSAEVLLGFPELNEATLNSSGLSKKRIQVIRKAVEARSGTVYG